MYAYLFSYRTINPFYPPWVKATHGDELAYVFGQALNSAYGHTEDEKNLSRKMMRYWSNFAKTGYGLILLIKLILMGFFQRSKW